MAKKKRKIIIPRLLLLICIISGVATLVIRILNRRLQIPELGELAGYAGMTFAISFIIIIGIWLVTLVNNN